MTLTTFLFLRTHEIKHVSRFRLQKICYQGIRFFLKTLATNQNNGSKDITSYGVLHMKHV